MSRVCNTTQYTKSQENMTHSLGKRLSTYANSEMTQMLKLSDTDCKVTIINALCLVAQSCLTLCDPMDHSPPGSSVHGVSPGKNTGVGCHALLQRLFLTQGSNSHLLSLLHWQADSLPPSHLRSPCYKHLIRPGLRSQMAWHIGAT